MKKMLITDDDISNITLDIKKFIPLKNIAKKYNICYGTLKKILKSKNISLEIREESANWFLTKPSSELLYFWGFILGDGCLTKDNGLHISLDVKDKIILERFCDWLGYPKNRIKENLRIRKDRKKNKEITVTLCLYNKNIINNATKYGIILNKTNFPILPNLSKEEIIPFLIGLIDADGHVKYQSTRISGKRIRKDNVISIVGNNLIMDWVISCFKILNFNSKIHCVHVRNSKRISIFKKEDVIKLSKILNIKENYKFALSRKWFSIYEYLIQTK